MRTGGLAPGWLLRSRLRRHAFAAGAPDSAAPSGSAVCAPVMSFDLSIARVPWSLARLTHEQPRFQSQPAANSDTSSSPAETLSGVAGSPFRDTRGGVREQWGYGATNSAPPWPNLGAAGQLFEERPSRMCDSAHTEAWISCIGTDECRLSRSCPRPPTHQHHPAAGVGPGSTRSPSRIVSAFFPRFFRGASHEDSS